MLLSHLYRVWPPLTRSNVLRRCGILSRSLLMWKGRMEEWAGRPILPSEPRLIPVDSEEYCPSH